MTSSGALGQPSDVVAESGDVIVEGPDGVAVTLTPAAAEETGRRLIRAATDARRQAEDKGAPRPHDVPAGAGEG